MIKTINLHETIWRDAKLQTLCLILHGSPERNWLSNQAFNFDEGLSQCLHAIWNDIRCEKNARYNGNCETAFIGEQNKATNIIELTWGRSENRVVYSVFLNPRDFSRIICA